MTLRFTMLKAVRAPKLTMDATKSTSAKTALTEITATSRIAPAGVLKRGERVPKNLWGSRWSRPMA